MSNRLLGMAANVDGRGIGRALAKLNLPQDEFSIGTCRSWNMARTSSSDRTIIRAASQRYSCQCAARGRAYEWLCAGAARAAAAQGVERDICQKADVIHRMFDLVAHTACKES